MIYFKLQNFTSKFSPIAVRDKDLQNDEEHTPKSISANKFTEKHGIGIELRKLEEDLMDQENASKAGVTITSMKHSLTYNKICYLKIENIFKRWRKFQHFYFNFRLFQK